LDMKSSNQRARPLRSQPTRDRILEAARVIFGRDGYDHATIRSIAAEAKINPAMVMRYYGDKESLFAAATVRALDLADFSRTPKSRLGEALVRELLTSWEDPKIGPAQRALYIKAASDETARAQWMQHRERYAARLKRFISEPVDNQVYALLGSQLQGLVVARYILQLPELVAMPSETIIREVGRVVQGYINRAQ
jgi:AcrR family transcriptional regulator